MPLPSPNLDDRTFQQLLDEAVRRVRQSCPEWNDLSPGDPGTVLLEAFAHLTEVMLYRLNRLPEKAYIEFLRLIGVRLQPPAAARAVLRFTLSRPADRPLEIPAGTRVTVGRTAGGGEGPTFTTTAAVVIPAGGAEADALALHCDVVQGEPAGVGTGLPGQSVTARRPPIVAPTGDGLDLLVGVEAAPGELAERAPARRWEGKDYRIWTEVANFTAARPDDFVYVADRYTGTITFAPALRRLEDGRLGERAALATAPGEGREIRLWYRRGGGPDGNVAAGLLTTLKDPVPGAQAANPEPASGGRAAETLENALVRGPQELHESGRAVTAADYERAAAEGGVARARACTKKQLWAYAPPGTVEVLLVPDLPAPPDGRVSAEALRAYESEAVRSAIARTLDERRPLGTSCEVRWVRYKTVRVKARVAVQRGEDRDAVRARVLRRLHQTINPLPTPLHPGWGFGRPLRASHLYDMVLQEPGVSFVDGVRFEVDEAPSQNVLGLAADPFQPATWYAAAGDALYRSGNDGEGWEVVGRFPGEEVRVVRALAGRPDLPTSGRPGLLAVVSRLSAGSVKSRVRVSRDCGETWAPPWAETAFAVEDAAWQLRDGAPVLLLAADAGLYELREGSVPVQVLVDPDNQKRGFYAVAVGLDVRGAASVAAAAQAKGGVYLSPREGRPGSFANVGLRGEDVRVLTVQYDGPRAFLWAATFAEMELPGNGCFRWEMTGATASPEGWRDFRQNWKGGSCRALALQGTRAFAATHRDGVARLDAAAKTPAWEASAFAASGLPLRDAGRLQPVYAVASDPAGRLLLAGGPAGVYRSDDSGGRYEPCALAAFADKVTLPEGWLFCSGDHEIEVVGDDEADRR